MAAESDVDEEQEEEEVKGKFRPWHGTSFIHPLYQWGVVGQPEEKRKDLQQWIAEKWFEGLPEEGIDIAVFQMEQCPKSDRAHIQWFVRFKSPRTFSGVSKLASLLPDDKYSIYFKHAWINQSTKHSVKRDILYCVKEKTRISGPWYYPDEEAVLAVAKSRQGRRTDLANVAEAVKSGSTTRSIAEAYPTSFIRYHRGIAALQNALFVPDASRGVEVFVIFGDARTSKTWSVWETFPAENIFKPVDTWFEGYDPGVHHLILLDDVQFARPGSTIGWSLNDLLNILEGRPLRIRVKGSSSWANWSVVIICHNLHPQEWYPFHPADQQRALFARFNVVQERRRNDLGVVVSYRAGNADLLPEGLRGPFDWRPPARGELPFEPRELGFGPQFV